MVTFMMDGLISKVKTLYNNIKTSIAFTPALITLILFIILILLLEFETSKAKPFIVDLIPYINIVNADTARSVVSSILTGIISLTVFSFSMVMVVINQAATNYSPKLVEGLITRRSIQYVLGVYIGTSIFSLICLLQIRGEDNFQKVPHLAIIVNILLFIYCVILFVSFINNISNSVKINRITERVYIKTIESVNDYNQISNLPEGFILDDWVPVFSDKAGYYQYYLSDRVIDFLKKHDLMLRVAAYPGFFLSKGAPLFYLNKKLDDQKELKILKEGFVTHPEENISINPLFGFRQLQEVAVKAISKGINDPGIAILCIDYLSDLLSRAINEIYFKMELDDSKSIRVIFQNYNFDQLLGATIIPIRHYGKDLPDIQVALLACLQKISYTDTKFLVRERLNFLANAILEESRDHPAAIDKRLVLEKFEQLLREFPFYFSRINSDVRNK